VTIGVSVSHHNLLNAESVFWKWHFFILACLPTCSLQCWGNSRSKILPTNNQY